MSPCLSGVDSWFLSSRSSLSFLHTNTGAGHICGFLFQSRTAWSNLEPTRASCLWWPPQGTSFNLKYLSRFTCHSPLMNLKTKIPFKTQEPGTWNLDLFPSVAGLMHLVLHSVFFTSGTHWLWWTRGTQMNTCPGVLASWFESFLPLCTRAASSICGFERLPPSVDSSNFLLLWTWGLEQLPSGNLNIVI